ncbi:sigma factor-like helix-turn-helix DNA-binding protein [Nocardia altamirensis]|uniref:sigma factor-like helix-turn-helix DNA-binding protein n=1 Tax=Nocardia altamirensis TaxID=472158 RepID=UPI0008403E70|nr:sigma factor-like helix-turn-helix DNA-binding protein [Nocardia altamirensis]
MSGFPHSAIRDLTRRTWLEILPWLAEHRDGPPLLGEGELLPNAWMSTAAGAAVPTAQLAEVSRRLAVVFRTNHRHTPFASAFPYATADPAELALSARAQTALHGTASLGEYTVADLGALPGVGPALVTEIVAALIGAGITADASTPAAVAEFERITATLDERDRYLLTARILTDRRSTLAECGAALGVSRERVNQLDHRLRARMHTAFHTAPALRHAADALVRTATPVAALARLSAADPGLDAMLPAAAVPLWFALAKLDDRVDIVDGWVVAETMDAARHRSQELMAQEAGDEGVAEIATLAAALGIPVSEAGAWLTYCGYRVLGEHVLSRTGSVPDSVAAILALSGKPLTFNEIHASMRPARSVSSVRNAMVSDKRFVKADRNRWALARWGTPRYLPIHRQIGEVLDRNGGRIALDDLVAELTETFDVKEFSVRTYAATGEYATVDGIVTRREQSYRPRKSPTKTRHLYRDGELLRWRTTLAPPHLKGSAFNLPSALAGLIGAGPGHALELTSRLGPQSIIWVGVQARAGTIKRFIDDLGLRSGDEVFLEFAPDAESSAQFDVVPAPTLVASDPLHTALAAIGHAAAPPMSTQEVIATLAEALWLPPSASIATLVDTLRARKEDELADLLTE